MFLPGLTPLFFRPWCLLFPRCSRVLRVLRCGLRALLFPSIILHRALNRHTRPAMAEASHCLWLESLA